MSVRRSGGYKSVRDLDIDGSRSESNPLTRMETVSQSMTSLAYNNMQMNEEGSILTEEQIKEMRERYGFCVTCRAEPVKLFEVKKSKLNPLWKSKEPLTVLHESLNGVCLKCNPALDPHRMSRQTRGSTRSLRSLPNSMIHQPPPQQPQQQSQQQQPHLNTHQAGSIRSLPNPSKSGSMRQLSMNSRLQPKPSETRRGGVSRENSLNVMELVEESPVVNQTRASLSTIHSDNANSSSLLNHDESPRDGAMLPTGNGIAAGVNGGGTASNSGFPTVADPVETELNQAFLEYSAIPDTKIKYGRHRVNRGNQQSRRHAFAGDVSDDEAPMSVAEILKVEVVTTDMACRTVPADDFEAGDGGHDLGQQLLLNVRGELHLALEPLLVQRQLV